MEETTIMNMNELESAGFTRDRFYKEVIDTYGVEHQIMMLFEEMAELQKEICKNFRGRENRDHIIEEMADVFIMMNQLQIIFDVKDKELADVTEYKVLRLKKRLEKKKALENRELKEFSYKLEQEKEDPFKELREACERVGNKFRENMNKVSEFVYDSAKYREEEKNED